MRKRTISLALAFLLLCGPIPTETLAAETPQAPVPVFSVSSATAAPGETVTVNIRITDNPGILGAKLTLSYDPRLTLVDAEAGEAFSALTLTKPGGALTSPCSFLWDGPELSSDQIRDGVVLTLSFTVSDGATGNSMLPVRITAASNDIIDIGKNHLNVEVTDGTISVLDYLPGDVNGDKTVDIADIILLRRYLVGGYGVTINKDAADVNGDGSLDPLDIITLRQYVAGGYGVALKPAPVKDGNANIVYRLSGTKSERIENGVYYWEFEIFDGVGRTLTGRSESLTLRDQIDNDPDAIMKLHYDAGGYVVGYEDVTRLYTDYSRDSSQDIRDMDVYKITDNGTYMADQLSLIGRTLYVTSDWTDMGLPVYSEAKALTIQSENGDVRSREFSSVTDALRGLAGGDAVTSGLPYSGDVIAALDSNGCALWVVFRSNTELRTGVNQVF